MTERTADEIEAEGRRLYCQGLKLIQQAKRMQMEQAWARQEQRATVEEADDDFC